MSYYSPFTGDVVQPTDVSYRSIYLTADTTLEWPLNGNDTPNYAARIMKVDAFYAGLKLAMPPASQTSVGQDALVQNSGANTFIVTDFDGNTVVSIAPGESKYIWIEDNATTAGVWGIIAFGVGTSNVDASVLAGAGLLASGTTLNQSHPTSSFVDMYTFTSNDRALVKVWSNGAGTATLPSAPTLGDNWFILFKNNGTGTMTISATGLETIDGSTSKIFQPNESAFIVCDGSQYMTVGYGVSNTFAFTALVKPVSSGAYTLSASEASNTIQEYTGVLTGNVTVT